MTPPPNLARLAQQAGLDPRYIVVLRKADEIRRCFGQEAGRFAFEDLVGFGQYGVACQVLQRAEGRRFGRTAAKRFVVKHALGDERQVMALKNEIRMLQRLQGASHILQPFLIIDNPLLVAFHCPSLVTEYVENGSLSDLIDRVTDSRQPLPNRLLWRVFLCLLRFVIAMAWPDVDEKGNIPAREEIRARKAQIVHNDMHTKNIMISDFDQGEHSLVPMLKLIDFGLARERPLGLPFFPITDQGVKRNIYDIGAVMMDIITGKSRRGSRARMEARIYDRSIVIDSAAEPLTPPSYPNLDPDLRGLVIWCLAINPENRPLVENLEEIISEQVRSRTAKSYAGFPYQEDETDERVAAILARLLGPPDESWDAMSLDGPRGRKSWGAMSWEGPRDRSSGSMSWEASSVESSNIMPNNMSNIMSNIMSWEWTGDQSSNTMSNAMSWE
ncbi:kinase-like domain-containing protein [Xylariaceae sp. FL0662B]|nr:kinase-like domain-containing protein [Xylariaceae sp. FL0662B]